MYRLSKSAFGNEYFFDSLLTELAGCDMLSIEDALHGPLEPTTAINLAEGSVSSSILPTL